MLAALLLSTALAAPPLCGLPMRGAPPPLAVPPHAPAPPTAALGERDPYDLPNSLSTDHFTARWGSAGSVDPDDVAAVLDDFETAWSVEVVDMDQPAPEGSDAWHFNVYIGDTGDGAPSGEGAGGYYDVDPEGYPMVVVARDTLDDLDFAQITAAHEFYHAIQQTLGTYAYDDLGAWYWESTAVWMSGQVFPDNADYAVFLFGYAFLPYLPIGTFDYPDTGALAEYHQYGAFIFSQYLASLALSHSIIRDSWVIGGDPDPLVVLDGLLASDGSDLSSAFTSFAAHNAMWDYPDQAVYEDDLTHYETQFTDGRIQDVVILSTDGAPDWATPPAETLPQRYGYNVLEMVSPQSGTLTVNFKGDAEGSAGSAAEFGATVVIQRDGSTEYDEVPLTDGEGAQDVSLDGTEAQLYLVVAASSDALVDGETFGYFYRGTVTPDPNSLPGAHTPVDCDGCATGPRPSGWLLALVAALAGLRRRSTPG